MILKQRSIMIHLAYRDFDKLFRDVGEKTIVLNDIKLENADDIDALKDKLVTIYTDNTVNTLPRCRCGKLNEEYLRGTVCDNCGSIAESIFDDLRPVLWLRADKDIGKFISPEFWLSIRLELGKSVDILRWISDPLYNNVTTLSAKKIIGVLQGIPGFTRNYKWMVDNLDRLLVVLHNSLRKDGLKELLDLYVKYKDVVLCEYIPLLNKRMFVVEKVGKVDYMNLSTIDVLDIILYFVKNINNSKKNQRYRAMARTNYELTEVFNDLLNTYVKGKKGIPRKLIDGFRSYFTVRGVITPILRRHRYDELDLPYPHAVVLFRPFIINYLRKEKNYTYSQLTLKLNKAVTTFDEEIYELMTRLLKKRNGHGIPVIFQRNPSLLNGSALLLRVTTIKRDPSDTSIGMSILVAKLPNADFDGDEMNLQLLIDEFLINEFKSLEPAASVFDMGSPGGISGRLTMTDPVIATISNKIGKVRAKARKLRSKKCLC